MLILNTTLHCLEKKKNSVFLWSQAEVLLCGIDSHKCYFETIGTIGAPDLSLIIDWSDSKLNPYAEIQTRMVGVPQERNLLATPVVSNRDLYSGGHRLNATQARKSGVASLFEEEVKMRDPKKKRRFSFYLLLMKPSIVTLFCINFHSY